TRTAVSSPFESDRRATAPGQIAPAPEKTGRHGASPTAAGKHSCPPEFGIRRLRNPPAPVVLLPTRADTAASILSAPSPSRGAAANLPAPARARPAPNPVRPPISSPPPDFATADTKSRSAHSPSSHAPR